MRRIEGSPMERAGESTQRGGRIKGVPVLKASNIAVIKGAGEEELIQKLPARQQDVIVRRYLRDGSSTAGSLSVIGDDLNLTREGVRQREVQALKNIQRLKEGKPPLVHGGHLRTDIDADEVVRLYVEENRTTQEIADLLKCSRGLISRRLESESVQRRRGGRRRMEIDINLLVRQYSFARVSTTKIAEQLGISRRTVYSRLKSARVKMRTGRPRKK